MRYAAGLTLLLALGACNDAGNPDDEGNATEVITTVALTFTPRAGGAALDFRWADPENDGSPVIDAIVLPDADDYDVTVSFLNELEEPAEDITVEVSAESDVHQVLFTGTAVQGPATGANAAAVVEHEYADTDENGFPVGLSNTLSTLAPGAGTFVVTLRHLPPESDAAVKTATIAEDVAAGGFDAIPGSTDAEVTFDLTVE